VLHAVVRSLQVGEVQIESWIRQPSVPDILHNADDSGPLRRSLRIGRDARENLPPDWILTGPQPPCEASTNQCHKWRSIGVRARDVAPAQNANAHSLEIAGRDGLDIHGRIAFPISSEV